MCVCVSCVYPLTDFLGQCGELVDVLACVLAAGHAEAKLEIKALEQLVAEVVSLNHTKVVDGCVTDCKLHSAETQTENKCTNLEANENTKHFCDSGFLQLGSNVARNTSTQSIIQVLNQPTD